MGDYDVSLHESEPELLDYPSRRVQHALFATALRLAGDLHGATVLDAGCGGGQFLALCQVLGADTTGFDLGPAVDRNCSDGEWLAADLSQPDTWPFEGRTFDVVTAIDSVAYVPNVIGTLRALWRHVAPGGRMVIVDLNPASAIWDSALTKLKHQARNGLDVRLARMAVESLGGAAWWRVQGLHLAGDQRAEVFDSSLGEVIDEPPPWQYVLVVGRSR